MTGRPEPCGSERYRNSEVEVPQLSDFAGCGPTSGPITLSGGTGDFTQLSGHGVVTDHTDQTTQLTKLKSALELIAPFRRSD
jgi:hypothetical protein